MKTKEMIKEEIGTFYEESATIYETLINDIIDGNVDEAADKMIKMIKMLDSETTAIMTRTWMKVTEKMTEKMDDDEELETKMDEIMEIMDQLDEEEENEEES